MKTIHFLAIVIATFSLGIAFLASDAGEDVQKCY
jgi:hypothetical protein